MHDWGKVMRIAIVLMAGALFAGDSPRKGEVTGAQGSLQGSWQLVELVESGADVPITVKINLIVKRDSFFAHEDLRGRYQGRLVTDETKNPKTIDFVVERGSFVAGSRILGIYMLDGDSLTICRTEAPVNGPPLSDAEAAKRPTTFDSRHKSGRTLYVYKRSTKR